MSDDNTQQTLPEPDTADSVAADVDMPELRLPHHHLFDQMISWGTDSVPSPPSVNSENDNVSPWRAGQVGPPLDQRPALQRAGQKRSALKTSSRSASTGGLTRGRKGSTSRMLPCVLAGGLAERLAGYQFEGYGHHGLVGRGDAGLFGGCKAGC